MHAGVQTSIHRQKHVYRCVTQSVQVLIKYSLQHLRGDCLDESERDEWSWTVVFVSFNNCLFSLSLCSQQYAAGRRVGPAQCRPLCHIQHVPGAHSEELEQNWIPGHDGPVWDSHQWHTTVRYYWNPSECFSASAQQVVLLCMGCYQVQTIVEPLLGP